jgi:hypothetical protein|tara:strand:+ start:468 stop:680 length:213 start_codon:yes stop_codon:yes gene_type:complete
MSDNFQTKWKPSQDQIDNIILPAYQKIAKQSVAYINEFGCPPEYVADMLRDIADALITAHPESENNCSCC